MSTGSFLHLCKPTTFSSSLPSAATALNVVVHPQALFSMLDHSLRRNSDQDRVIGTLLGTRSEDGTEIEIRSAFAVPHAEADAQVEIDMEYHKTMYNLYHKANPKEILVGWYATSLDLNPLDELIQYFYYTSAHGTFPHPAVHLTMQADPRAELSVRTYISTSVGVIPEQVADSCLFVPVPHELRYSDAERSGLELIANAKDFESREISIVNDVHNLENSIEQVLEMIDRVGKYVSSIIEGKQKGSIEVGKFLYSSLTLAPKVDADELEQLFNSHLQDVLLMVYLSNTLKAQVELFNNLKRSQAMTFRMGV
ncbi:JAB1/Mov34/MPN/PAD-1 ubiquitin protease-domain-containing protein [Lipomyces oligophaga]|uniref:JAB1/Mov34/MPN/PAD-1 ubiquitin protease-domain-containing protein n=1 Tax=Lipomyces oligophaga TaxID=45792 RepID=UPI0034CDE690